LKNFGEDATGREETEVQIFASNFYVTKTLAITFWKNFLHSTFYFQQQINTALQNFILVEILDYLLWFMR
jgi:hypothetical protein